jgi:protein-tyrosine-phosphatase
MTTRKAQPLNVLFLCTGNSARSILAEAILNRESGGRFRAVSAGSHPKGQVHPAALDLLRKGNFDVAGLRSKSWDEFAGPDAPKLDFVFTVCDNAAGESCPYWPGAPVTAHWGIPDPAAATGSEADIQRAFDTAFRMLSNRISAFLNLPVESLEPQVLKERLAAIGKMEAGGATAVPARP